MAIDPADLTFRGRCFCFTGKLADMKRSAAMREARSRGALTVDIVNELVDYLVVGSVPAPAWKYGSYGLKIEQARELRSATQRPHIIPEAVFIDALGMRPSTEPGQVDEKVFLGRYKFIVPNEDAVDLTRLERSLRLLWDSGFHVRADVTPGITMVDLFDEPDSPEQPEGYLVFEIRLLANVGLDAGGQELADRIEMMMEGIRGVDGTLAWSEQEEGTASFVRLIREMRPRTLRP